jgi:hypothetical protein
MIVLIALVVICVALLIALRTKNPVRNGSGPIVWRGGRRQLTEEAAAKMVVDRLRGRD